MDLKILFSMLSIGHLFQFVLVPTTNIPTRISKDTISTIYLIIANSIINNECKT